MANVATDLPSVEVRFRNAMYLYPMQRRVSELTLILGECSMKDLQLLFHVLVEQIFGVNPTFGNGWNLLRIARYTNGSDFDALFKFLHPHGPFFEVIYKLLGDVYLKYEYSLQFLPSRLKQMILDGSVPSFYMDKLQIDPGTRAPVGLILNSFEFYMFHFAYHLINPWQVHSDQTRAGGNETIYLHLSDQYLSHFLPIETSVVLPSVPVHQTMPLPRSPPPQAQLMKTPKLFKTSVVKLGSASLSPPSVTHPHAEVWRSETLIQIAIYIWLSIPDQSGTFNSFSSIPNQNVYRCAAYGQFARLNSYRIYPEIRNCEDTLPKEDHLRVIRNMIKHIHYFSNNIHNDGSAMDELRKVILSLCQRPLYMFLRRHIHHWPLDSSFLLILETYLSFIQPWRYVKYNARSQGESCPIDSKWFNFIAENLLAYSVVIHEIIPRFERIDLTSPKHAHMLYRLAKVLSQPNLSHFLREIEGCLDEVNVSSNNSSYLTATQCGTPKSTYASYLHNSSNPPLSLPLSHRLNAVIRQEIQELEPPNFQYKPLFSPVFREKVIEFIKILQQSHVLVKNLLNAALAEQAIKKSSFAKMVKDFLWYCPSGDDYTVDERQKTVTYLEHSITLLCEVFEVPVPSIIELRGNADYSASSNSLNSSSQSHFGSIEPSILNPRDWQLNTKLIKYEANPDLEPIRSTEIAFLVRFLHQVSSRMNEMYGDYFQDYWHRNDFWGGVARQLLAPPCQYHYFNKTVPGSFAPRVAVHLPARVCLRPLATHQTLSYFFLSGLLAFFYEYPIIPFYFIIFCLYVLVIFAKVLLTPYLRRERQNTNSEVFIPLDVSFNE